MGENNGKHIFRASSLTAPAPIPPFQGCGFFGVFLFLTCAAVCAKEHANIEMGDGGATPEKSIFPLFSPIHGSAPKSSEMRPKFSKTQLCKAWGPLF